MTRCPFSFEFFPPNTPVGSEKLQDRRRTTSRRSSPSSSASPTAPAAPRATRRWPPCSDIAGAGHEAAPHLSCVGSTATASPRSWPPTARRASAASSRCAATCPAARRPPASSATPPNWSSFIRADQGDDWHIEVAAYPEYHPQQRYARRDLQHFADKVKAGADSAITQFFFNADAYFHFVDEVRKIGVDGADRARHHADPQLREDRAVRGARRHRDPALGGAEDGRLSWTTRRRSAPSASMSSPGSAND